MPATEVLSLIARDTTKQKTLRESAIAADTTIQQLIQRLVRRLGLPAQDAGGAAQSYHAFLERTGAHLHPDDAVGQTLRDQDEIVLHPDVQAGCSRTRVACGH